VVSNLRTTPVLLVDWVRETVPATASEVGLGCGILIILSFIVLLFLKLVAGRRAVY
jgi:hypothetical protein